MGRMGPGAGPAAGVEGVQLETTSGTGSPGCGGHEKAYLAVLWLKQQGGGRWDSWR